MGGGCGAVGGPNWAQGVGPGGFSWRLLRRRGRGSPPPFLRFFTSLSLFLLLLLSLNRLFLLLPFLLLLVAN